MLWARQFCKGGAKEHDFIIWMGNDQSDACPGHWGLEEPSVEECIATDSGYQKGVKGVEQHSGVMMEGRR